LYSTKTFEEKILKIEDVQDFCWCPTKSIISYFIPENGSTPAKVALIEIPTKKELRSKNFYGAIDVFIISN
jgi:translation initiation factor 3 subunit B